MFGGRFMLGLRLELGSGLGLVLGLELDLGLGLEYGLGLELGLCFLGLGLWLVKVTSSIDAVHNRIHNNIDLIAVIDKHK